MKKTISGTDLRDRLLARMAAARSAPAEDWVQVLASSGNRELLSLIGRHSPGSISELAELAGRAQPNVSRSLSALIGAGLIEVNSDGRRSIPALTPLGMSKAGDLGLLDVSETLSRDGESIDTHDEALFSVQFKREEVANAEKSSGDGSILGDLFVWLNLRGNPERSVASFSGDLNALALHVVENWWRMLYRRDAPFKICDLSFRGESAFAFAVTSLGRRIEIITRAQDGVPVLLERGSHRLAIDTFEKHVLEEFLLPVVSYQRTRLRMDRPVQDLVNRLRDSQSYTSELSFCKTAGALGLSPYELSPDIYDQIRSLMSMLPEEETRLDFASAVLSNELKQGEEWTRSELQARGADNALPKLVELRTDCAFERPHSTRPWEWATSLARVARQRLALAPDQRIEGSDGLARLFGASQGLSKSPEAPGSLRAVQSWHGGAPTVVVEDEGDRRTSFVLARAIGDYLAYGNHSSCVADLYTDRQAVGRAFAAEFMAPAEGVIHMVERDDQSLSRVAGHYGVPNEVIWHQYNNNYWR